MLTSREAQVDGLSAHESLGGLGREHTVADTQLHVAGDGRRRELHGTLLSLGPQRGVVQVDNLGILHDEARHEGDAVHKNNVGGQVALALLRDDNVFAIGVQVFHGAYVHRYILQARSTAMHHHSVFSFLWGQGFVGLVATNATSTPKTSPTRSIAIEFFCTFRYVEGWF